MFFNQRRLLQFPLSGYAPCISCGRTRVALVVQKEDPILALVNSGQFFVLFRLESERPL